MKKRKTMTRGQAAIQTLAWAVEQHAKAKAAAAGLDKRVITATALKGAMAGAACKRYNRGLQVARKNGAAEYAARIFARTCAANAARAEFEAAFTNHVVAWPETHGKRQDEHGMTAAEREILSNTCLGCEFLDDDCLCTKTGKPRETEDTRCSQYIEWTPPLFLREDLTEIEMVDKARRTLRKIIATAKHSRGLPETIHKKRRPRFK